MGAGWVRAHPVGDEDALTTGSTERPIRRCSTVAAARVAHERLTCDAAAHDELSTSAGCRTSWRRGGAVRGAAPSDEPRIARAAARGVCPRRVPEAGHDATRARARRGHLLLAQVERLGDELAGLPSAVRARGELRGQNGSLDARSSSTALAARRGRLCLTSSGRSWHSSYAASAVVSDGRASTYDSSHTSGMVSGYEPRSLVGSRRP